MFNVIVSDFMDRLFSVSLIVGSTGKNLGMKIIKKYFHANRPEV